MAVMYMLGSYLFASSTTVPRSVQRDTEFKWVSQERLGRSPARQAVGYGADTIKLSGTMFPCSSSNRSGKEQISLMRLEAGKMQPLMLVDGNGYVYGRWTVDKVGETRSHLWQNSDPRKIEFNLDLEYYGEDNEGVYSTARLI